MSDAGDLQILVIEEYGSPKVRANGAAEREEPALPREADPIPRLSWEVAVLACRLGAFMKRAVPSSNAPSFLGATFEAIARGKPQSAPVNGSAERRDAGSVHPLDRLAGSLGLSAF